VTSTDETASQTRGAAGREGMVRLEPDPDAVHASIPVCPGVRAGISLLEAGNMSLSRRGALPWRERFCRAQGLDPARLLGTRQVHSRSVIVVDGEGPEDLAVVEADGLVTGRRDAVLSVTVADCLPVFIADRRGRAFGLVHSGWKGTGIAREAVRLMARRFGVPPADLAATIGPGIGACCYAVPEDRARAFAAEFGPRSVVRSADGAPRLDLRAANVELLAAAGVTDVSVVEDCTCCTPFLGSFRRQGPEVYALMLAYARLG
jgi:polyphenol oxidase